MRLAPVPIAGTADRTVTAEAAGRMATGEAAGSAEEGAEDIRLLGCLKVLYSTVILYRKLPRPHQTAYSQTRPVFLLDVYAFPRRLCQRLVLDIYQNR